MYVGCAVHTYTAQISHRVSGVGSKEIGFSDSKNGDKIHLLDVYLNWYHLLKSM
jgi:uncharacterized protein (UPF0248 family)